MICLFGVSLLLPIAGCVSAPSSWCQEEEEEWSPGVSLPGSDFQQVTWLFPTVHPRPKPSPPPGQCPPKSWVFPGSLRNPEPEEPPKLPFQGDWHSLASRAARALSLPSLPLLPQTPLPRFTASSLQPSPGVWSLRHFNSMFAFYEREAIRLQNIKWLRQLWRQSR